MTVTTTHIIHGPIVLDIYIPSDQLHRYDAANLSYHARLFLNHLTVWYAGDVDRLLPSRPLPRHVIVCLA